MSKNNAFIIFNKYVLPTLVFIVLLASALLLGSKTYNLLAYNLKLSVLVSRAASMLVFVCISSGALLNLCLSVKKGSPYLLNSNTLKKYELPILVIIVLLFLYNFLAYSLGLDSSSKIYLIALKIIMLILRLCVG
tara:strand:- start:2011 stop:2415 length:405 start_codon:yes stop_codon:yes gene_type:complete